MKKPEHFIKKIITCVFALLLIITAFLPAYEVSQKTTLGDNENQITIASGITLAQLVSAGNATEEEILEAAQKAEAKTDEIEKLDLTDEQIKEKIKSAPETCNYVALLVRNDSNIIGVNHDDLEFNLISSSGTSVAISIILYVLAGILLVLLVLSMFFNIKILRIITKILAIVVLVVSLINMLLVFATSINYSTTNLGITAAIEMSLVPLFASPLAILTSLVVMIMTFFAIRKPKQNIA